MHAQEGHLRAQTKPTGMVYKVLTDGGFHRCVVDHLVFYKKTNGGCVVLAVYVDDILLTGSDAAAISNTEYLRTHFVTKNMDRPKYFLGIEFAYSRERMSMSQRKYTLVTGDRSLRV